MGATLKDYMSTVATPSIVCSGLPTQIRALYIATRGRTGGWLAEAFAADSALEVILEEAVGSTAGLARLRDEAFDIVLLSHEPGELDALELIEGYRAGGANEPILVLGSQSEQEMAVLCYEVGGDEYVCVHTATTRNLIWKAARAIQRYQLRIEHQRLSQAEQSRLQREHEEAQQLLAQQGILLGELQTLDENGKVDRAKAEMLRSLDDLAAPPHLPPQLIDHYHELLRTYVIMGSGNLTCELHRLASLLVSAGLSAQQVLQLHLHVVQRMLGGLGTRSTRHVMTRADLLVMEVMVHLTEGYRRRYQQRIHPPRQLTLPGFE